MSIYLEYTCNYTHISRKRFITRIDSHIMEAKMSHHLLFASWRPRKAHGVVSRPQSQGANGKDFNLCLKI